MTLGAAESEQVPYEVDRDRRLIWLALVGVGLVVSAAIAAHLVDFGVYQLRIQAMNANLGTSPVAWISPAAILVALLASVILATRPVERSRWVLAFALGAVLVLGTHHLGESLPHWQVLLLPPLGLTLVLLWRTAADLDSLIGRVLRSGCVLLVLAFALHVFGALVLRRIGVAVDSWPYQVKVALKEGSELSGWLLIAAVLGAAAWAGRGATRPQAV
jgi:hypothetical protein